MTNKNLPQPWIPEIDVTASLACSLIEAQWPALAPARVEPLGVGWDNTAYLVNEQFVFRFPQRLPMTRAALDQVHQRGLIPATQALVALVDDVARRREAEQPRHTAPLLLVHGDVYASHLLIDASGALCGIIDWGNLHAGRAAVDLMAAHLFLPPPAHAAFRAAYGPITEAAWRMARLRAVYHASVSAVYGHEVGDEDELRESLTALHYMTQDQR